MLDNIREFQVRVLHSLSTVTKLSEVDNSKLLTLIQSQRILHQLKDMSFEDSDLREIIRDLYKTNYAILHKYGMDDSLYQELSESPNAIEPKQAFFDSLVDRHLKEMVDEYKDKEEQELSNQAKNVAECVLLGIPRKYLKTSQLSGEEKLYNLLESIHREEQLKKMERTQELSLFKKSKNLADYKCRKEQSLNDTLDSVI